MILASILFATAGAVSAELLLPIVTVQTARFVDLGKPGAMEQLAEDNPAHYEVVTQVMEAARHIGCDGAAQLFKARGASGGVACTNVMVLTSYPPKKRVSVFLDATTYTANVTLEPKQRVHSP